MLVGMNTRLVNALALVLAVPSLGMAVVMMRSHPDDAYRIEALAGFVLLAALAVGLLCTVVAIVVDRWGDGGTASVAVTGLVVTGLLALLTTVPFLQVLVG
jgi:hypothetical protein